MWWTSNWPYKEIYDISFSETEKVSIEDQLKLDSLFSDTLNYDYSAITTLDPNLRIMFYSNNSLAKEIVLSAQNKGSIISFISLPHNEKESRTHSIFMTQDASESILTIIAPYVGW